MNAAVRPNRQAEVDARLRTRVERLQRLLEAGALLAVPGSGAAPAVGVCFAPAAVPALKRRPQAQEAPPPWADDRHQPLLPFPGYPNAANAHAVEECIGLNLLGAGAETRDNVLRELQLKLARTPRYTYVCVTDLTDFSFFIQRGITFEYIGYLDRLADPRWRRYFELNMALIRKKYGLAEFVPAGDPRYVV